MLPTNVVSFMKKMVSNTEGVNSNQFGSPSNSGAGAIGRLRQTLQQAQETVSNRLQAAKPQSSGVGGNQAQFQQPETPTQEIVPNVVPPSSEEKENTESPRPGSAGRCRVCVKAMKPDEYSRECTECGLKVCDDCASYSNNAEGNEVSWRCSVCRRRGVAIIARRVQPGIEQSEALEGVGFETAVRKSPDARRLQAGGRADSETEVLLLAPKPSDVRRHSDVPLRDIAKFQAQSISQATSQHDLGLSVGGDKDKMKARSSSDLPKKDNMAVNSGLGNVKGPLDLSRNISNNDNNNETSNNANATKKQGPVKRQRSYERGASEGTLNLPVNRGRRASCDLRSAVDTSLLLNNNSISNTTPSDNSKPDRTPLGQLDEKTIQHLQQKQLEAQRRQQQEAQQVQQQQQQQQQQQAQVQGGTNHSGQQSPQLKNPPTGNSDLTIRSDNTRRRSVQIYNTTAKAPPTPRSCASLDTTDVPEQKKSGGGGGAGEAPTMKRQGSSTDGEAIKIVIDDVDSTFASDNNKGQSNDVSDFRTRVVRLRRDPQDRGYQTRGFGIRVVGGCSSPGNPGNLRARVARVTPGSGADFAGIRRGDIVLTWNGIKFTNLTFEEVCKVMDASSDTVELTLASADNESQITVATVPEDESTQEWDDTNDTESLAVNSADRTGGGDRSNPASPTNRRQLPRLPPDGRIQLRLYHDEVHNTLEVAVVNIAFGQDDCTTLDLNDIIITLRIGDKLANTRWNQCTLFTKVSPEDLFDSWLVLELVRGPDFLGEAHVDMGRVSLDDRPVWFPFSAKGSSSHRGSISQITTGGQTPPSARELARRLRMRGLAAGSQSQSEEQDDSSGQSSPCASSLLRPEVAWEVLGTLGPPGTVLTCRSAPTSRRGSAQSDRGAIGIDGAQEDGRGSAPSTPAMPRSLPPSRRGSFAIAVEEVINRSRRGSVACQRAPDFLGRQLPEIPDSERPDPSMLRNRRNSAWNPREVGYDRRAQFERTDSLRAINPTRRTSADFRGDFGVDSRNRPRKSGDQDENWRQCPPSWNP